MTFGTEIGGRSCRTDSVYVFDPQQPSVAPWLVLDKGSRYIAWSPDGQWIAALTQTPEDAKRGLWTIVAVPVTGGLPISLINRAEIAHFRWASNGNIYYWEGTTGLRRMVTPPSAWQPENLPFSSHAVLIPHASVSGALKLHRFVTAPVENESALTGLEESSVYMTLPKASFPDGLHYLVAVYDKTRGVYTCIVDQAGNLIRDFGNHTDVGGL